MVIGKITQLGGQGMEKSGSSIKLMIFPNCEKNFSSFLPGKSWNILGSEKVAENCEETVVSPMPTASPGFIGVAKAQGLA